MRKLIIVAALIPTLLALAVIVAALIIYLASDFNVVQASTLLLGFGLVITVADAVPRYDVTPTCRAAVNLVAGGGEGRTVESCLAGEERARKELEKDWSKIPSAERSQCIATMG